MEYESAQTPKHIIKWKWKVGKWEKINKISVFDWYYNYCHTCFNCRSLLRFLFEHASYYGSLQHIHGRRLYRSRKIRSPITVQRYCASISNENCNF